MRGTAAAVLVGFLAAIGTLAVLALLVPLLFTGAAIVVPFLLAHTVGVITSTRLHKDVAHQRWLDCAPPRCVVHCVRQRHSAVHRRSAVGRVPTDSIVDAAASQAAQFAHFRQRPVRAETGGAPEAWSKRRYRK